MSLSVCILICKYDYFTYIYIHNFFLIDEMEQLRRNCLQEGHKMTNDCQTEKTVGFRLVRCTCEKDLCNISERTSGSVPLLFSVLTILWIYHSKLKWLWNTSCIITAMKCIDAKFFFQSSDDICDFFSVLWTKITINGCI